MKSVKTFSQVAEKYNPENDHIFERACDLLDERLDGAVGEYGCDLHNYVFNEIFAFDNDKQAEVAVDSVGVWSAIRLVKKYEQDRFGESSTPIDPYRIGNMVVYIYGDFMLNLSEHLQNTWDDKLTAEDLDKVRKEIIEWCVTYLPDNKRSSRRPIDGLVWDEYQTY